MTSSGSLLASARTLARDQAPANYILKEVPDGLVDGANTVYRLSSQNIIPGTVYFTVGSSFRINTGFSLSDSANGIITFTAPPAVNSDPFYVDYNFYWCSDIEVTEFILEGSKLILNGGQDPTQVPNGLVPALLQFALFYYFQSIASQYGRKYSSSGGQAGQSVDTVTRDYLSKANTAWKVGVQMRDDYYKRQGQREAPTSGTVSYGIDPYTPMR